MAVDPITPVELGVLGYSQSMGYIQEEFLPALRGASARKAYREMLDNDATIGAVILGIKNIIRQIDWEFEKAEKDIDGYYQEFCYSVLDDMENDWTETLSEILSMLGFGFSVFEKVYKLRKGMNAQVKSKYSDNLIGVKVLSPRPQETIQQWEVNENTNQVTGFYQEVPNKPQRLLIPITKCVHFKTELAKGNPEGRSILRNAYKSYIYLKNTEVSEAIAIDREMNGLPVVRIPSAILNGADAPSIQARAQYLKIIKDVKMGQQTGLVLPSDRFKDLNGNPTSEYEIEFQLIASNGKRAIDTDAVIKRYMQNIARSMLADFLVLGLNDRGSFAMSKSKTDVFLISLQTFTKLIANTMQSQLFMELWGLNGFDYEMMPRMKPKKVAPINLQELSTFIDSMTNANVRLDDAETAAALRDAADLPVNLDVLKTNEELNDQVAEMATMLPTTQGPKPNEPGTGATASK